MSETTETSLASTYPLSQSSTTIDDTEADQILNNYKIEESDKKNNGYLRSALDELNKFSDGSTEVEEDIEESMIKIKDSMFWSPSHATGTNEAAEEFPKVEETELINESANMIIEEMKHEGGKEEDKLLSSSLREALKMLREED